jgi:hypothetical protein
MAGTHSSPLEDFLDELARAPVPGRQIRVRESNTIRNPDPLVGSEPGSGQAPQSIHGPFLDAYGVLKTVEVFLPEPLSRIQRVGATQPFLYFSQPAPPVGGVSRITLGAGTVWILASQLAPLEPSDTPGFVALRVVSGTIVLVAGSSSTAGQISIPANRTAVLTLTLPDSDAPRGPPDIHVSTPLNVTFRFTAIDGYLTSASPARFSAFGTTIQATRSPTTASYDRTFDRLSFPFTLDASSFRIATGPRAFSKLSGTAPITGGFWSLPVNFTTPETLGAGIGTGGISLALGSGLTIDPPDLEASVELNECVLSVEPKEAAIGGVGATAAVSSEIIGFWAGGRAQPRFPAPFQFRYLLQSDEHQSWALRTQLVATLDQPRTVKDEATRFDSNSLVHFGYDGARTRLIIRASPRVASDTPVRSYALKNVLLGATAPSALIAVGTFSERMVTEGTLSIFSGLRFLLPFLPDPYAVNLTIGSPRSVDAAIMGAFMIQLKWQPGLPPTIEVELPESGFRNSPIAVIPPTFKESTQLDTDAGVGDANLLLVRLAQQGILMLDLSTNVSQFGVCINGRYRPREGELSTLSLAIKNLHLQATNSFLNVMTIPPIQWEPVKDLASGKVLSYPDSGPSTVFAVDSQKLVPVAPRPAIDSLVSSYQAPTNNKLSVRFGLPFSIVAFVELQRSRTIFLPSPRVSQVQPLFSATNMKGGDQISLVAASRRPFGPNPRSPSLPGIARQFLTALTNGEVKGDSVIGMGDTAPFNGNFNTQFGGTATSLSSVPVRRIDISGFGESIFSDWRGPDPAPGEISKVLLQALVGRAAKEVIQVFSIIFPFAIRVVRTVTIERLNDATVVRHDSGWQATSDGRYNFATTYPSVQMHPGVVRSCTNVVNIRDVRGADQIVNGIELRGVRFDCSVEFDGIETGQGSQGVPALNQLGYLQIGVGTFEAAHWAALLGKTGPLGGLVDCTVNIGNSGLRMDVLRIGVGASLPPGSTVPHFAMAAWGTVVFPRVGQWSFLRTRRGATAAEAADERLGTPLIRQGVSPNPPPASNPYRFANPEDLLSSAPAFDYGILFSTGTQRVQFRRPKIEADGINRLTSVLPPIIADVYAMGVSSGPFPALKDCVPFRSDLVYYLAIGSNGSLKLWPDSPYQPDPLLRHLRRSNNSTTIVRIGNEAHTGSNGSTIPAVKGEVMLQIDTEAAVPWTLSIKTTSYSTNDSTDGELMRVSGDIVSNATNLIPQFLNSDVAFGPAAAAAAKLMAFLESIGPLPKLDCGVTNPWELQAGCFVNKSTYEHFGPSAAKEFIESFCDDLEVSILMILSEEAPHPSLDMAIEITFHIGSPQGAGFFVLVIAGGGFSTDGTGTSYMAKLGFGVGYQTKIASFSAQASCSVVGQFIKLPQGFDVGGFIVIEAEIDFGVVVASARSEGGLRFRRIDCEHDGKPDHSNWRIWQLTVAVEVHIFWLIDIEFEHQMQSIELENNGKCDFGPEFA